MIGAFTFEQDGRTYTCSPEKSAAPGGTWWWFAVSRDSHRYAPFQAPTRDPLEQTVPRGIAEKENNYD